MIYNSLNFVLYFTPSDWWYFQARGYISDFFLLLCIEREKIMANRREQFEVKTPMDSGIFASAVAKRTGREKK